MFDALFNADGTPISDANYTATTIRGHYVFESDLEITSLVAEGSYYINESLSVNDGIRCIDETRYINNFSALKQKETSAPRSGVFRLIKAIVMICHFISITPKAASPPSSTRTLAIP